MIGFILGATGALLIGLVIGDTIGLMRGYKYGLNHKTESVNPVVPPPLQSTLLSPRLYQSALLVRVPVYSPESYRQLVITDAKYDVVKKLGEELAKDGILSPEVSEFGVDLGGSTYSVSVKLMVLTDPKSEINNHR